MFRSIEYPSAAHVGLLATKSVSPHGMHLVICPELSIVIETASDRRGSRNLTNVRDLHPDHDKEYRQRRTLQNVAYLVFNLPGSERLPT